MRRVYASALKKGPVPPSLLASVLDASQGKMSLNSHMQAELVTWEITALMVALGAGLAGAGTANGLKQGLCVAIGAIAVLAPIHATASIVHATSLPAAGPLLDLSARTNAPYMVTAITTATYTGRSR